MLTNSTILCSGVIGNRFSKETRLTADVVAERIAYKQRNIGNIAHIGCAINVTDTVTKFNHSSWLEQVVQSTYLKHPIWQYVLETNISFDSLPRLQKTGVENAVDCNDLYFSRHNQVILQALD